MAIVRMTGEQARASARVDRAKVQATTEEDVRHHMIGDGEDSASPAGPIRVVRPAAEVRKRTGLSQDAFANALGVPVATIRNWEQGRTIPDPAARALLTLVANDPERAFRVLAGSASASL